MSFVFPLPVPSQFFDRGGSNDVGAKGETELKVYFRRGKQKQKDKLPSQAPSQEVSLDLSFESGIVPSLIVSFSIFSFDDTAAPIAI